MRGKIHRTPLFCVEPNLLRFMLLLVCSFKMNSGPAGFMRRASNRGPTAEPEVPELRTVWVGSWRWKANNMKQPWLEMVGKHR